MRSSVRADTFQGQLTPAETSKKVSHEASNLSASVSPTSGHQPDPFKDSSDIEHSVAEQEADVRPVSTAFNVQIIRPEVSSKQISVKQAPPPKSQASIVDLKQFLSAEKTAIGIQNLSNLVEVARSSREIGTF
jgi:hypothetical protein